MPPSTIKILFVNIISLSIMTSLACNGIKLPGDIDPVDYPEQYVLNKLPIIVHDTQEPTSFTKLTEPQRVVQRDCIQESLACYNTARAQLIRRYKEIRGPGNLYATLPLTAKTELIHSIHKALENSRDTALLSFVKALNRYRAAHIPLVHDAFARLSSKRNETMRAAKDAFPEYYHNMDNYLQIYIVTPGEQAAEAGLGEDAFSIRQSPYRSTERHMNLTALNNANLNSNFLTSSRLRFALSHELAHDVLLHAIQSTIWLAQSPSSYYVSRSHQKIQHEIEADAASFEIGGTEAISGIIELVTLASLRELSLAHEHQRLLTKLPKIDGFVHNAPITFLDILRQNHLGHPSNVHRLNHAIHYYAAQLLQDQTIALDVDLLQKNVRTWTANLVDNIFSVAQQGNFSLDKNVIAQCKEELTVEIEKSIAQMSTIPPRTFKLRSVLDEFLAKDQSIARLIPHTT